MPTLEKRKRIRENRKKIDGHFFVLKIFRKKFFDDAYFPGVIYIWGNPVFARSLFEMKKFWKNFFVKPTFSKSLFQIEFLGEKIHEK